MTHLENRTYAADLGLSRLFTLLIQVTINARSTKFCPYSKDKQGILMQKSALEKLYPFKSYGSGCIRLLSLLTVDEFPLSSELGLFNSNGGSDGDEDTRLCCCCCCDAKLCC
uniref:Uncharacterized protein n=1 Tax=Romanomermis culicivorax TaxID=13658 RepID=A0A915KX26_ROMCU